MKTIKIIDILCYISIGEKEKIPKKVKWRDSIWEYDNRIQDYTNGHLMLFEQLKIIKTKEFLNDEVEIIEEDKKIEKLNDILRVNDLRPPYDCNLEKIWIHTIKNHNKINELIDEANRLKEETK